MKNNRILIVCAHIDDETFAMGGTIHKLSKNNDVKIIIMCSGTIISNPTARAEILNKYSNLEVSVAVLNNYDLELEKYTLSENIKQISHIVSAYEPDIVFTHSKDSHPDHNIVSEMMDVICRFKNNSIEKLYHFAVPGNIEWSRSGFKTNTFYPLSEEDIKFKKKISKKYNDLFSHSNTNPLYYKNIKSRDRYSGSLCGSKYAEQFQLILSRSL